jgi:hypothetical protein
MTAGADIFRLVKLLIDQHGDTAEIAAAHRADELLAKGDMNGQSLWLRNGAAIRELRRDRKDRGALH